jgi:hypothetical protein
MPLAELSAAMRRTFAIASILPFREKRKRILATRRAAARSAEANMLKAIAKHPTVTKAPAKMAAVTIPGFTVASMLLPSL